MIRRNKAIDHFHTSSIDQESPRELWSIGGHAGGQFRLNYESSSAGNVKKSRSSGSAS